MSEDLKSADEIALDAVVESARESFEQFLVESRFENVNKMVEELFPVVEDFVRLHKYTKPLTSTKVVKLFHILFDKDQSEDDRVRELMFWRQRYAKRNRGPLN